MLTPTETAQARTLGIRLRLVKAAAGGESGAQGLLATSWDRGKDVLNGIGAGAKGSVYAGIYAGVPAGMLWFALDRQFHNGTWMVYLEWGEINMETIANPVAAEASMRTAMAYGDGGSL